MRINRTQGGGVVCGNCCCSLRARNASRLSLHAIALLCGHPLFLAWRTEFLFVPRGTLERLAIDERIINCLTFLVLQSRFGNKLLRI